MSECVVALALALIWSRTATPACPPGWCATSLLLSFGCLLRAALVAVVSTPDVLCSLSWIAACREPQEKKGTRFTNSNTPQIQAIYLRELCCRRGFLVPYAPRPQGVMYSANEILNFEKQTIAKTPTPSHLKYIGSLGGLTYNRPDTYTNINLA